MADVSLPSATFTASAALSISLTLAVNAVTLPSVAITGTGDFTASLTKYGNIQADFGGESSLSADLTKDLPLPVEVQAAATATSGFHVHLSKHSRVGTIAFDGAGTLAATLTKNVSLKSGFTAESSLTARVRKAHAFKTDFRGESGLSVRFTRSKEFPPVQLRASARLRAKLCIERDGLSFNDLVNEVMWLWGISKPCHTDDHIKQRAVNDINYALQLLWSQAPDRDYFSRSTLTLNFTTGETSKVLADNVQNIVGPARIANPLTPLSPLQSRGEYDNYATYYLGYDANDALEGVPHAYYIERLSQHELDATKINLHLTPAPQADTSILIDVVCEAPRYKWDDFNQCSKVPIPHRYIESILIPVILERASGFYLFIKEDRRQKIRDDYQMALAQLGMNDPSPAREEES